MANTRSDSAKLMALAVHELRTPVSVVAGYLRILQRQLGESITDQQRAVIKNCEESCNGLAGLLRDLSDLANFEAGRTPLRLETVELGPLVGEAAATVVEGRDRGITLEVVPLDEPLYVLADRTALGSAFATLFTAVLRERAAAGAVHVQCVVEAGPDGAIARILVDDPDRPGGEGWEGSGPAEAFTEYRGGLGFKFVMATRAVAAHGGTLAAPDATRGRLSLLVSLPLAPPPESPR